MSMDKTVLTCTDLCKSYRVGQPVLDGFSCSLQSGKIVGLLGPNGCGKSTLMKLICGILVPDSGEITVCGEVRSEATNAYISYLPERTYFNSWMRVEELIAYFSDFYEDFDAELARRMLDDLHIDTAAKLKALSKGTKEKVQLIMVMSRKAKLYLLDEPIGGVDPATRDYILDTIIRNYDPEAVVLISTHLISDVEKVLDEVLFINQGKVTLQASVDDIRQQYGMSVDEYFREVFKC